MSKFPYSLKSSRVVVLAPLVVRDEPNEPPLSDSALLDDSARRLRIVRRVTISVPDVANLSSLDIGMIAAQLVELCDSRGECQSPEQAAQDARQFLAMAERIRVAISGE